MFAAVAFALFLLVTAWPVNAVNAQTYWGYGVGNRVWDFTETGQAWQGNGYGYAHYQAYSAGYQQGLGDAQAGLTYDCFGHTQYYCNGYSQGFNTYENNSQQQTQTQVQISMLKANQEQSSGIGRNYI